ncbi:DUF1746-domain-containing protein [Cryphonectria parasitica EP155]|uniref:DUF1746-domain-containing protein n=1 Tax=Cryphonectria parasitica (strain ATCC 38755 / EP155) TaxID=660469 RepID=A0A9P4XWV5_CRYP1|nr:DUF1746-domain-containing protein [Cryphonectria parasitica EP155]KAF3762404.1 DUF1746-domain-containing protein [Cryphonectria parasitica EP155]
MNDDPTAASDTARLPARDENDSDAGSQDDDNAGEGSSQQAFVERSRGAARRDGRRRTSSRVRRAKAGIAKKLEFMTHLMSSLDVVVFAELCALYYMDCSFARLVLRSSIQYLYLTPKPEDFLKLVPAPRPQIYTILASNILCILSHLIFSLPQGSETMRGYLHGGVIIDFIGQKAPTSRLGLLLLDCLILLLQCIMCAVSVEKDRLKQIEITLRRVSAGGFPKSANTTTPLGVPTAAVDLVTGAQASRQDLDSEERGIMRDDPLGADDTNNIEMRPLTNSRNPSATTDDNGGASGILEARYQRILRTMAGSHSEDDGPDRPSLVDVLMSGNGLLANFHVVHALRTLVVDSTSGSSTAAYSLQLTGYTSRLAAMAADGQRRVRRQQGGGTT